MNCPECGSEMEDRKPYSGRWMLVFTVELDLQSEFDPDFGELSEEMAGVDLTSKLEECTKNHTWKHVVSFPQTEYWLKKKRTDFDIQWDTNIDRLKASSTRELRPGEEKRRETVNLDRGL